MLGRVAGVDDGRGRKGGLLLSDVASREYIWDGREELRVLQSLY